MKVSAKIQSDRLVVKLKTVGLDSVNSEQAELVKNKAMRGVLKFEGAGWATFKYSGPAGVTLKNFLKNKLSKYDYFNMMAQILGVLRKIDGCGLTINNILFETDKVFINEITKELLFIYLPVNNYAPKYDVRGFMEKISFEAEFQDDDIDYVAEYINYVNSLKKLDLTAVENYISGEDELIGRRIARGSFSCGYPTTGRKTVAGAESDKTDLMDRKSVPAITVNSSNDDATELLHNDEELKMEFGSISEANLETDEDENNPRLINSMTNEVVFIDKCVFRIGKERGCVDFCLDNPAISRKHADIIIRSSGYYISDCKSANHTYVNDNILHPGIEVEIHSGDTIRFANEEFAFYV